MQIAIKTCARDLDSFLQLQSDLLRFGYRSVRVSVPEAHRRLFASAVHKDFELISDESILAQSGLWGRWRDNWYSQQFIKLLLVASSNSEICWLLDANTVLLKPLPQAWTRGRLSLACDHRLTSEDLDWYVTSARFLGFGAAGPLMAPVNQPLMRSVVRSMMAWIAFRYMANPLLTLIGVMRVGTAIDLPIWTEFGLYRCFAIKAAPDFHRFEVARRTGYYVHDLDGPRFETWRTALAMESPAMVKVYAKRAHYALERDELDRICQEIRTATSAE